MTFKKYMDDQMRSPQFRQTYSALKDFLEIAQAYDRNPPAYENNDVIVNSLNVYLEKHPEGLQEIENFAMGAPSGAFLCDMVFALGCCDHPNSYGPRVALVTKLLLQGPSMLVRDSALLALMSLDYSGTSDILRQAMTTEKDSGILDDLKNYLAYLNEKR